MRCKFLAHESLNARLTRRECLANEFEVSHLVLRIKNFVSVETLLLQAAIKMC